MVLRDLGAKLWKGLKTTLKLAFIGVPLGLGLGVAKVEFNRYMLLKAKDDIKKASVLVLGDKGVGSGIVVKSNHNGSYILTNKHVCRLSKIKVKTYYSKIITYNAMQVKPTSDEKKAQPLFFPAQVVKVGVNYDLCLLHTDVFGFEKVNIANRMPEPREFVMGYSNPRGIPGVFSEGIAGTPRYIMEGLFQPTTIYGLPGSSGSGVFNKSGELVGLVALRDNFNGILHMVPLPHIRHFLDMEF